MNCRQKRQREYYIANKEKIRNYNKEYYKSRIKKEKMSEERIKQEEKKEKPSIRKTRRQQKIIKINRLHEEEKKYNNKLILYDKEKETLNKQIKQLLQKEHETIIRLEYVKKRKALLEGKNLVPEKTTFDKKSELQEQTIFPVTESFTVDFS